jgi:hypothetical protein
MMKLLTVFSLALFAVQNPSLADSRPLDNAGAAVGATPSARSTCC